jgi:hypothetical protein
MEEVTRMRGFVVVLLTKSASASLSQPDDLDACVVLGRLIFVIKLFGQICMNMSFCFVAAVLLGRQNSMHYLSLTLLQTSPQTKQSCP